MSNPNSNQTDFFLSQVGNQGEGNTNQGPPVTPKVPLPPTFPETFQPVQQQIPPQHGSEALPHNQYNYGAPNGNQGWYYQDPRQQIPFSMQAYQHQPPIFHNNVPIHYFNNIPGQIVYPNQSYVCNNNGQVSPFPSSGYPQYSGIPPFSNVPQSSNTVENHFSNNPGKLEMPPATQNIAQSQPHPPVIRTTEIPQPNNASQNPPTSLQEISPTIPTSSSSNVGQKRIVIFGETGTGKSSIVNMLLNSNSATTSSGSVGCTFTHQTYSDFNYCFYDTVGLGEGSAGTVSATQALKLLVQLLKSTEEGIHLLIYVLRKGRITKNFETNYDLFYKSMCGSKVPILLVVTHCELDEEVGGWWESEKHIFEDKYQMKFAQVICGCATDEGTDLHPAFNEVVAKCYVDTRSRLIAAIETHSMEKPWRAENWLEWVRATIRSAFKLLSYQLGEATSSLKITNIGSIILDNDEY